LAHLLAHNSAAYHPTMSQHTQSEVLSFLYGRLQTEFFAPFANAGGNVSVTTRAAARSPVQRVDLQALARRNAIRQEQSMRWDTHKRAKRVKNPKAYYTRRDIVKRTVFTKRKETPLKRRPAACLRRRAAACLRRPSRV